MIPVNILNLDAQDQLDQREIKMYLTVQPPELVKPILGDTALYYVERRTYAKRKGDATQLPADAEKFYQDLRQGSAITVEEAQQGWMSWGASLVTATVSTWGFSSDESSEVIERTEIIRPRILPNVPEYYEIKTIIIPPILGDHIKIHGSIYLVPLSANRCLHICDLFMTFGSIGVSGLVTQIMVDELKKSYRQIPACVKSWLELHPNDK